MCKRREFKNTIINQVLDFFNNRNRQEFFSVRQIKIKLDLTISEQALKDWLYGLFVKGILITKTILFNGKKPSIAFGKKI
jgi:hypothetical protein